MRALTYLIAAGVLVLVLVAWLLVAQRGPEKDADPLVRGAPNPTTSASTQHDTSPIEPSPKTDRTGLSDEDTATSSRASPTPPIARDVRVLGRLLDARGVPIAGAKVFVAPAERTEGVPLENLDPAALAWSLRTETATDALGRFDIAPKVTGGLRFAVRAPGFAPHDGAIESPVTTNDLGDVVLADSVVLMGRVLDSARRPVAGATLRRLSPDARPAVILADFSADIVATTDADGAFRIDELAHGPWMLLIRSEGRPDKIERGTTKSPGEKVDGLELVLADGAEISGRVVGANPNGVALLFVRAVPKRPGIDTLAPGIVSDDSWTIVPRSTRCESDGSFVVSGLTPGIAYRLAVCGSETERKGSVYSAWVDASAGATGVEIVYVPETALVFQVVDAVDGKPVTELEVHLGSGYQRALMDENSRPRTTFPDGRVRFPNAFQEAAGRNPDLMIEARGFRTLHVPHLTPVAGQDLDLGVLRLERAPRIHVIVLDDATGEPIADAHVNLYPADDAGPAGRPLALAPPKGTPGGMQHAKTDEQGRALLNSLSGKRATLTVNHFSYASFRSAPLHTPSSGDLEETIRLHRGGSVTVQVRDASGAPVQGVQIRHTDPRGNVVVPSALDFGGDEQGNKTWKRLDVGRHRFEFDDADLQASLGANASAEVEVTDDSAQTVTLTLPARGRLSGRVTEAGEPLSGATLRFLGPDGASVLDARTNGEGEYVVSSIALGSYRVGLVHPTRVMPDELQVHIDEARARFDVDLPVASIEGRLVDEAGAPVKGMQVGARAAPEPGALRSGAAEKKGNFSRPVASDAEGRFVLRGVNPEVDLVVTAHGGHFQSARSPTVRLARGQTMSDIELRLTPGAELSVRLTATDGRSAGCLVRAVDDADVDRPGSSQVQLTDQNGHARFRGLRPGNWRIHVEPKSAGADAGALPVPDRLVEVRLGEPNSVTIALP